MSLDRVGDMLAPFLDRLGITQPSATARLTQEWDELAGDPWAASARPAGLNDGELVLDVVDAAAVSVLRYRTGELLQRLHEALGEDTVEVIRLRVTRRPF